VTSGYVNDAALTKQRTTAAGFNTGIKVNIDAAGNITVA